MQQQRPPVRVLRVFFPLLKVLLARVRRERKHHLETAYWVVAVAVRVLLTVTRELVVRVRQIKAMPVAIVREVAVILVLLAAVVALVLLVKMLPVFMMAAMVVTASLLPSLAPVSPALAEVVALLPLPEQAFPLEQMV